jgi:hypothetical protein
MRASLHCPTGGSVRNQEERLGELSLSLIYLKRSWSLLSRPAPIWQVEIIAVEHKEGSDFYRNFHHGNRTNMLDFRMIYHLAQISYRFVSVW